MKPGSLTVVRMAGFAACCLALFSCQTATDPVPETTGPMVATVGFEAKENHYPDSADWSSSTQSGTGGLTCSNEVCTDTLRLRDALGSEGAQLRLWSLGIRIATLQLSQTGRSTSLKYTVSKDTFEIRVLDEFLAFKEAHSDSFAKIGAIGAANLVTFYAAQILSGAQGYSGFPGILPVGMKTDSVKRAFVALGPQFALTWSKLAVLGLGLDSSSIRVFAMELFVAGKLSDTDTLSLFPRHPLRVLRPLSVTGELVPGGAAVPLSGAFSWNKGRIVSAPTISVRTSNGTDPGFVSSAKNWPSNTDTSWSLADNVTISAPLGATPGIDTLVVILSSDSGYSVEARAIFRVVPRDAVGPVLRLVRPGSDTTVPNETYSLVVEAMATDSSGIDSIRIRNTTRAVAPYLDTVYLGVGENRIVVQAWDKFGNSSLDTVKITRSKPVGDTTAPKIVRISPLADTVVPWATKSISLSWTVTDDSSLARVALDDGALVGNAGYYQKSVALPVGSSRFVLVATDANGNTKVDSLHVRRSKDTIPPDVRLVSPSRDTSVAYRTSRILVTVVASDSDTGLDSVKIGATKHLVAPFADSVDLATGPNRIVLQAWDKAGLRTERVLTVERAASPGDTTAPVVLHAQPTKDTTVGWGTKSFQLSYSIVDDSLLSKVWLNDSLWTGIGSVFQKTVNLQIGTNVLHVVAQDARGNRRLDTLRIVRRADTEAPALTFVGPTKDTSVAFDVGAIQVSVKASDANGIDSIRIGTRTFASDAASDSVALVTGANRIVAQAWDKAGNRKVDTLQVTRLRDMVMPKIVRASGASEQVLSYPSSSSISWTVTDNDVLAWVKIQGQTVQGSKNVYTANISVVPGRFSIVIEAADRAGNISADTVWWTSKLMDTRDRKSYNIVAMPDGRVWMAEDLALTLSCENSCTDSFYTWSQAMKLPDSCDDITCKIDTSSAIQGICPNGWHLPSVKEWNILVDSAGLTHLKSTSGWAYSIGGVKKTYNGDDLYGFRMLPRTVSCSMAAGCTYSGEWWTPSQTQDDACSSTIHVSDVYGIDFSFNSNLKQVRCVSN